jgi:hypothetical protein
MGATAKDLHVDKVLTEFAMGYRPEGMIADMIFPVVTVDKQTDIYLEADRGRILRRQKTKRAPGNEALRVERDFGSATYHCLNYALKDMVTIEDKANTDPSMIFAKAETKAQGVLDDLFLDWEIRVLDQVFNTANVGSSAAVSSEWDGAGDPLGDVNTGIDNVRYANGKKANRILYGPEAWDSFRRDSTVRNLIFGTNNGGGYPNEAQVAKLLDVEKVMVSEAFENSADDGQTESLNSIAGDNVLIYYAPSSPTIEQPSFGYSIRWQQANLPAPLVVERHPYNSRTKSEEVEAGYYQDEKITGASYAFLLTAVNSST